MSFEWLDRFQQDMKKPDDYADKTLAAYKLGMRAKGSIAGVNVVIDPSGCRACQDIDAEAIFHPDAAPRLPLPDCDRAVRCSCVYRPVMTYQLDSESD